MNKKLLIVAAVAGLFLMTRKASATTVRPLGVNGSVPASDPFAQIGGAIGKLLTTMTNPAIVRPAGYTAGYNPDTAGEAAARNYYVNNLDQFAVNPPTISPEMTLAAQREGLSEY